jgi:hypothetical protein
MLPIIDAGAMTDPARRTGIPAHFERSTSVGDAYHALASHAARSDSEGDVHGPQRFGDEHP